MARRRYLLYVLAVAPALALGACYRPSVADGAYRCVDRSVDGGLQIGCPEGMQCAPCKYCVRQTTDAVAFCANLDAAPELTDASEAIDAPSGDAKIVSASACTLATEHQATEIAFCRAGWREPGVDKPVACNRSPGPDGYVVDGGAKCSIADNCASGWHVCSDDGDVLAHSNSDICTGAISTGFWATRAKLSTDGGCASGDRIGGCMRNLAGHLCDPGCSALNCAAACSVLATGGGGWECMLGSGEPSYQLVIRTDSTQPGGVICCKD